MATPRILKAILGVVTLSSCLLHVKSETPTIDLTLIAPWSAPNLLVEVAETVATYNETAYFEFIQTFTDINQKAASSLWSSRQIYDEALKVVSRLGDDQHKLFQLSLAIHEAAPRIQAYNQLYSESVVPLIDDYDDTCEVWVQIGNKQICQLEELSTYITYASSNHQHAISIFPFDHVYSPTNAESTSTFVLYTDRFSKTFLQFHDYLLNAVEESKVSYVLRYRPSLEPSKPLYLSGYGVELALKKTDYLVIDDRDSGDSKEAVKEKFSFFGKKANQHLFEAEKEAKIEPLTSAEIANIGLKASQYIAISENPLLTMEQLSQDFPKYAKRISKIDVNSVFEEEITENQMGSLQGGMSAVWINGKPLEDNQIDPFFLLRTVRSEKKIIQSFQKLGFTAKEAINILSNPSLSKSESESSEAIGEIYDVRDTPEKSFIVWWNDLEKDKRYKVWPSNLMELLKPTYPGQLHTIRKNIYNLLMIEDLSRVNSLSRVVLEIRNMVGRNIPIRFGMVALVNEDEDASTLMSKINNFITQEYGKAITMKFLTEVLESAKTKDMDHVEIDIIKTAFNNIIKNEKSKSSSTKTFEEVLASQSEYAQHIRDFSKRMSIREWNDNQGLLFLNGKFIEFGVESPWIQAVLPSLMEQTRFIQTQLFTGELSDDTDIYEYIMDQPHVSNSRNSFITTSAAHPLRILSFDNVLNADELKYIQNEESTSPTTNLWVISDLNTLSGLKLASNALKFVESNHSVRLSLFHSPSAQDSLLQKVIKEDKEIPFSSLLYTAIHSENADMRSIQTIIEKELTEAFDEPKLVDQTKYVAPGSPIIEMMAGKDAEGWSRLANALKQDELEPGYTGIVINGRIVGPIPSDTEFSDSDFENLFTYESKSRITPVQDAIQDTKGTLNGNDLADTIMHITSIIEQDKANTPKGVMEDGPAVYRNKVYEKIPGQKHSKLVVGDDNNDTFLEIGLIIDPISESAQKMSTLFHVLSGIQGVSISIYLNPSLNLKEMPLKRFYRYVFDDALHFDTNGAQETPMAYFSDLPVDPLYTLGVETTNAWHVSVLEANMDLDNILLTSLGSGQSGVSSVYELERILVEGHCLDMDSKGPPRGLQFELGTPTGTDKTDTIVMANLGYFQLKALPGVWELGLREGRSSDLYKIHNMGTNGAWDWTTVEHPKEKHLLTLTSFEGVMVMPLVKKKPGMESEDVLEGVASKKDSESGLWSSLSNKLFGKHDENTDLVAKPVQADINIFSVASGKLYERFLSIMIASVMKHTESTVKFWFIENFLSPEFKDFVPSLAKEYNFDYEMVTYKWPSWLRAQNEKQRTIWGYKILFLDVLFPLSLDKVIFVDADQIVRTDLKELVDMDLKGAPYGYTPFCSDRTEMDGFRFWSEGYWKSHLRGRPYHISALYVVDLVRFRQMAAGDRLRSQYQQLSADPNSLANLDQDLPNNMQHVVPIFSLPQEWLWCETWCSDESLKKAKTIDLCNNPLTKEPKLDRARRQVPEWEVYDQAIDGLLKRIKEGTMPSEGDGSSDEKPAHIKDEL